MKVVTRYPLKKGVRKRPTVRKPRTKAGIVLAVIKSLLAGAEEIFLHKNQL